LDQSGTAARAMAPKYPGQSVQRAGAAAGKLMKGLVDPSKPKRIRIRKRDVSAPPRGRARDPRGPPWC
jgi:hypothetical protein